MLVLVLFYVHIGFITIREENEKSILYGCPALPLLPFLFWLF